MPYTSPRLEIPLPYSTEYVNRAYFLSAFNQIDAKAARLDSAGKIHADQYDIAKIPVPDPNNYFNGTNLSVVLDELFTFADNGRKGIASVVGAPAVSTDPFATLASKIQTAKNTMATNLTAKNVPSAGTETLQQLANKITGAVSYEFDGGSETGLSNQTGVNYKVTTPRKPKMVWISNTTLSPGNNGPAFVFPEAGVVSSLIDIVPDGFISKNTAFPGFDWRVMY